MSKAHDIDRFKAYYNKMHKYFSDYPITGTVVIETPSGTIMGNGRKALILFGVYLICISEFFPYYKVFLPQPTAIKKAHTGSGRADKKQMILHTQKKGFNPKSDHLADAFAMSWMSFQGQL